MRLCRYLRVPLVLSFFATEDRIHKLQSAKLRGILDSVLFEPGRYLHVDHGSSEPEMVPTQHKALLSTPYGLILNELLLSPDTIIQGVLSLMNGAMSLDTGSVCDIADDDFSVSVDIILYIVRLGARLDNYVTFAIQQARNGHPSMEVKLRDVSLTPENLSVLDRGMEQMRNLMHGELEDLLDDYLSKLDMQIKKDPKNERLISRNSRLSSDLHAHKLLLYRNSSYAQLDSKALKTVVGSFAFLTTRHTWNRAVRNFGRILVPEHELYELLTTQRRKIITFARSLEQYPLDEVMQTALEVATSSTGCFRPSKNVMDIKNRWSIIRGPRSRGRFAVGSTRASKVVADGEEEGSQSLSRQKSVTLGEIADTGNLGVELNLQLGQVCDRFYR